MDRKPQIYPSDIFAAADAYTKRVKAKTGKEPSNAYGAFRINFARATNTTFTTYLPFEVNLVEHGWTPLSLKFLNLKHVGRIAELSGGKFPRKDAKVKAVNLLFKEDYVFDRQTRQNGKTVVIKEPYGKAKDLIDKAYLMHVKRYQKSQNGQTPKLPASQIIPLVKRHRNEGEGFNKKPVPIVGPGNINVSLKFKTEKDKQPDQTDPNLGFRCPILDARHDRANRKPGEWVKDDAKLPDANGDLTIPVNNGNIHAFIRGGSLISGVDNMGAVCLSQGKISLPSKLDLCIVRPAKPQRVSQSDFDDDDMATIDGAVDPEPEPTPDSFATSPAKSAVSGEFAELGNLDGPDEDDMLDDDPTDDDYQPPAEDTDEFGDPDPDDDEDLF